jgi:uncharacterized protein YqeY
MNLKERLDEDMKLAMKSKASLKLSVIRLLKSSIKNEEISKMKKLGDDEIIAVIQREIKRRKESMEEYKKAGREELEKKEEAEANILYEYLPAQASDDDLREYILEIASQIPEGTKASIGIIMPKVLEKFKGRAEGKRISILAKEIIS